jgi:hypothetical protein
MNGSEKQTFVASVLIAYCAPRKCLADYRLERVVGSAGW